MVTRTLDGTIFTQVANHETVRPLMGGSGYLNLMPAVADPNNYSFMVDENGGFIVMPLYEGVYEVHTVYKNNGSALKMVREMKRCRDYMFTETLAEALLTKVADDNAGAIWLAEQCGFQEVFWREAAWSPLVGLSYRKLDLDRWTNICSTLEGQGRAFHEILERAKLQAGSEVPVHVDDAVHDRAVGAAVAMIKAGNVIKGVNTYNRWAVFAGYAPVSIISLQPVVVDIMDAVMGLNNGDVEVIQCR